MNTFPLNISDDNVTINIRMKFWGIKLTKLVTSQEEPIGKSIIISKSQAYTGF